MPSIKAASILARTTGATSDITLASGTALQTSGTGSALVLAAGQNFINNSGTATPFTLTGAGSRWLVYSTDPTANTRGGLLPGASDFGETYAANAPATIGTGNRFIYSTTTHPVISYTTDNKGVTYGNAIGAGDLTFTYNSGLITGDTLSNIGLTGSAGISTTYVQGTTGYSASAYTGMINGTTGTLASVLGYQFAFSAGDLTVGKRTIVASLTGAVDKVYDGTDTATLVGSNYSISNIYGSDDVSIGTTGGTYSDKNAGTGKTVTVVSMGLTGSSANNYQLGSTTASGNVGDISQKDMTVSGLVVTAKTYDGNRTATLDQSGIGLDGYVSGDDITLNGTSAAGQYVSANAGSGIGVTVTGYTATGTDIGNYNFTQPTTVTGTINKKDLTVTADAKTVTYGTSVPTGSITYNGFITGESAAVLDSAPTVSSTNTGIVNAGTYTGNYTVSGGSDNNYSLHYVSGDLVVSKKQLDVTADSKTITYGASVPTGTYTYNGFVNGEDASALASAPVISSTQTGVADAGTYNGNYTITGGTAANYSFNYISGNLVVNKKGLNVTANNQTITYGDAIPTTTISYSGFVNGDDATDLTTLASVTSNHSGLVDAGTYTGNYVASGAASANYTFNYIAGNLVVSKKQLNVTAGNRSITYGDTIPADTLTYSGFITGQDQSVLNALPTVTSSRSGLTAVGTYAGNYVVSGGSDNNYSFNFVNGTLTVVKKDLYATANNQTITYGNAISGGTISYSGFVGSQNASVLAVLPTVSSTHTGLLDAGTYTGNYVVTGGSATNYNIIDVNGNLTVARRALTVTTDDQAIYPGDPSPTFTGSNNLLAGDAALITWVYAPVGYSGGVGNYVISATATDVYNRLANYIRSNNYGTFAVSTTGVAPPPSLPDSVQKTSQVIIPASVTSVNILPPTATTPIILISQQPVPATTASTTSGGSTNNGPIPTATCGYLDPNCHIQF